MGVWAQTQFNIGVICMCALIFPNLQGDNWWRFPNSCFKTTNCSIKLIDFNTCLLCVNKSYKNHKRCWRFKLPQTGDLPRQAFSYCLCMCCTKNILWQFNQTLLLRVGFEIWLCLIWDMTMTCKSYSSSIFEYKCY